LEKKPLKPAISFNAWTPEELLMLAEACLVAYTQRRLLEEPPKPKQPSSGEPQLAKTGGEKADLLAAVELRINPTKGERGAKGTWSEESVTENPVKPKSADGRIGISIRQLSREQTQKP
jgi:hypothetical protein